MVTASMVIADIKDLVECVDGRVTAETRLVTAESTRRVPFVHAVVGAHEFKVFRPTFRAAREELRDWLATVAV